MAGTLTASIIKNDTTSPPTFQNSAGTEIGTLCRAWVQFTGSTAAINGSFNVSSVTRTATGQYTVNLTNALANTNYSVIACGATSVGTFSYCGALPSTTSSCLVGAYAGSGFADNTYQSVAVFR